MIFLDSMVIEKYLLGKDHDDPERYAVEVLDQDTAIGIASVVRKEQKPHNWFNNEDAVGVYRDKDIAILMVADAHLGRFTSEQAVLTFSGFFKEAFERLKRNDIAQAYLEAVVRLSYDLNKRRNATGDGSNTQFHSFIAYGRQYYSVGIGDCYRALISGDTLTIIPSQNSHITLGGTTVNGYMKPNKNAAGLERDAVMHYDDPIVRNGVDVTQIPAKPGDVVFLCSDGFPLKDRKDLPQLFKTKDVAEAVQEIMADVLAQKKTYRDNVSIAAYRIT